MGRNRTVFSLTWLALASAILIALSAGKYPIDLASIGGALLSLTGLGDAGGLAGDAGLVLWRVRLPRILLALLTGASLSLSGVVLQALFKNPLVSPSLLGVTFGASFGAAVALLFFSGSVMMLELSAFAWGLVAVGIAYQIGKRGAHSITTLVLAGFVVSSLFKEGVSFIQCKADPLGQLPAIVLWTMGSFAAATWSDVLWGGGLMLVGLLLVGLFRWGLNPMALGEEEAMSLGVNVLRRRAGYICIATLMAAAATASCGRIEWVGLVIPHMARMVVGADHEALVPYSALLGALFMLSMDTLARTLPGGELPVGVLTAAIGAPCFGYLLIRSRRSAWSD